MRNCVTRVFLTWLESIPRVFTLLTCTTCLWRAGEQAKAKLSRLLLRLETSELSHTYSKGITWPWPSRHNTTPERKHGKHPNNHPTPKHTHTRHNKRKKKQNAIFNYSKCHRNQKAGHSVCLGAGFRRAAYLSHYSLDS